MKKTLLLIAIALIGSSHNVSADAGPTCPHIYRLKALVGGPQPACADVTFEKVAEKATRTHSDRNYGRENWVALNTDLGSTATLDAVKKAAKCTSYYWKATIPCSVLQAVAQKVEITNK